MNSQCRIKNILSSFFRNFIFFFRPFSTYYNLRNIYINLKNTAYRIKNIHRYQGIKISRYPFISNIGCCRKMKWKKLFVFFQDYTNTTNVLIWRVVFTNVNNYKRNMHDININSNTEFLFPYLII